MKVSKEYYDEVFEFAGQWDMPSSCGLKVLGDQNAPVVIVTELYQDNPGTSVTYAGRSLAEQICKAKGFDLNAIRYIECNPNTNSKLSFYDEEFFEVTFLPNGELKYHQLTAEEVKILLQK